MSDFVRSVRMFANSNLSPQARSAALAAFAREDVARLIQARRASPVYTVWVDGREGAPPETVRPDGRIVYRFNGIAEATAFALAYCVARSPVGINSKAPGTYRKSWVVLVDGREWTRLLTEIPAGAEALVVNTQPYHRKIDMGSQGAGALGREVAGYRGTKRKRGAYVSTVEGARQELLRRFPGVSAARVFVELPNGPAPAPYTLKGGLVRGSVAAALNRRSSAFRAGRTTTLPRFSREGEAMTYPALRIEWGR